MTRSLRASRTERLCGIPDGAWRGNMLMAAMSRSILHATFDDAGNPTGQERMLTNLGQRFRDIRTGPDGLIYALTDETLGAVLRIEPGQ